ncbi:choice-of-anchor L domain-containing protein [uncultured Draconibacterium sp.]|uniref:Ig-like domain-containing protein n=1 Tax=uncultured Draconibacterium sp. TaxID=1573823 RepID=UPI002AA6FB57|nr:choice-of-anchor L domain-containing protein [uncultured Draconibacterium sp.]
MKNFYSRKMIPNAIKIGNRKTNQIIKSGLCSLLLVLSLISSTGLIFAQEVPVRIPEEEQQATLKSATILKSATTNSGSIKVAQNATYNSYSPEELVENILVSGCLSAENVKFGYYRRTYSGWDGWRDHNWSSTPGNRQLGYFNKGDSDFPLEEGLLLSTGKISSAEGPNDLASKTDAMEENAGDPDLETISGGYRSYDASVLEFDFVPAGNTLEFKYVFASEEYREWTCSRFNDAFGFFLSGPGITGSINLAKLPNGTEVSISNIHGEFTEYDASKYYSNQRGSFPCAAENEIFYIDNGSGKSYTLTENALSTQFDGMTVVLTATHEVQPNQTYHIKLALADISDQKWDAGVFLEAKSFTTTKVNINQPDPVCYPNTIDLTASAITAGSSPNLTYTYWEDEAASISYPTPTTATAGTYYIKGFDSASGCSDIQPVTVTVHSPIVTELHDYHNDLICIGGTDGSFKVEASGGTPPYLYSLDNTSYSNTTGIFEGLAAGTYTVYVKDANDCESQSPLLVEITEPETSTCGITKDNCPPIDLAAVCFDGEGGTPVFWTPPGFVYSCCATGEGDGSSFDVQFNIPESKNSCWIYNNTQRIGSDNMRLWQSATADDPSLYQGNAADVFFVAPFQYFDNSVDNPVNIQLLNSSSEVTIGWNLVVLKANSDETAYTIEAIYSVTTLLAAGNNSNPSETPLTLTIPANDLPLGSGIYKLKFEFTGPGNNKLELDYLNYNAILSDLDGCSEGINFVVTSNHNPGDEFPIGTTEVVYTATLTQPGGFTLSDNCIFDVVVNDAPTPSGNAIQSFCAIDNPTVSALSVAGNNIQWFADATGGQPLDGSTLLVDGEDYFASQTIDGCESLSRFKVNVVVSDPDKPSGESTQTFCLGSEITIADLQVTGENIKWYANESDRAPLDETELLVNGATYYATQTVGDCESDQRLMVTVVIEACCTGVVTASGNSPVCVGDDIDLSASFTSTADSVKWKGPDNYESSDLDPDAFTATTASEGDYIVCVFYNSDCVARDTIEVIVNEAPEAPEKDDDITECETDPIQTLNANDALVSSTGVTWFDAASGGNVVASPTLNTVGTKTYYAEYSNGTCSSLTRTAVTLTINEAPEAPEKDDDITECETDPIQTLNANDALVSSTGVTWFDAASGGNVVASPTLNTVGTKTYYAEYSNGTCSSLTRTAVTLTIYEAPEAPEKDDDITECETDPIQTLSANDALVSSTGVTWFDAASGGNVVASPTLNTVGTKTYYAEYSNGTCSSLTRTAVTLTINEAPEAPEKDDDITECETDPIQTLNANDALVSSTGVTWFDAASGGNVVASPTLNTVGTKTYYAEYSNGTCSSLTRTAVTLTINEAPEAPEKDDDITECETDPIQTLSANDALVSSTGVTWFDAASGGNVVASPTLNTVGTKTYYAEYSNGTCSSLTRTAVTLTINEAPEAPEKDDDITECETDPIQMLNANDALVSSTGVTWFDAASGGNVVASPTLNTVGTKTYYAEYSNGTCSSLTRTAVTLTINEAPICNVTGTDGPICTESVETFYAPEGLAGYAWSIDGNGSISGSTATDSVNVVSGTLCDSTYTVYLTVTNSDGCSSDCEKTLMVGQTDSVSLIIPGDTTVEACISQSELESIITNWKNNVVQTNGGCNAQLLEPEVLGYLEDERTCGGEFLIEWKASSDCQDLVSDTTTITISTPDPLIMTVPEDTSVEACDGASLLSITQDWMLNGATFSGACYSDQIQTDTVYFSGFENVNICGDEITITWVATDPCGDHQLIDSAKIKLLSPDPLIMTVPKDTTIEACESETMNSIIEDWKIFGATFSGPCYVQSGLYPTDTVIVNTDEVSLGCGTVSITWIATDMCNGAQLVDSAKIILQTDPLIMTVPEDTTIEACDIGSMTLSFEDGWTSSTGSTGLAAILQDWALNGATFSGACYSDQMQIDTVFMNGDVNSIYCGGEYTITWIATDICGGDQLVDSAKIIVSPTDPLIMTVPKDTILEACTDIEEITSLEQSWLTSGLSLSGACYANLIEVDSPQKSGNITSCGGKVTFVWSVQDLCSDSTFVDSASITLLNTPAPVIATAAKNDTTECARIVNAEKSAAIVTLDPYQLWLSNHAGMTIANTCGDDVTWTDNSDTASWTGDGCERSIEIIFTATNSCNLSVSDTATFVVHDTQAPELTGILPADTLDLELCIAEIPAGPSETDIAALYDDNCNTVVVTKSDSLSGDDCNWKVIYTYTVTDKCGNAADNVTVTYAGGDSELPTATAPNGGDLGCNPADSAYAALDTLMWEDNCDNNVFSGVISGTPEDIGDCYWSVTHKYWGTDNCGNSDTLTQTYTWIYAPALELTAPNDTVVDGCTPIATIDSLYIDWLSKVNLDGGCITDLTADTSSVDFNICGDTIDVIWKATSSCLDPVYDTATFIVAPTSPVILTVPADTTIEACLTHDSLNAIISNWNNNVVNAEGGCNPEIEFIGSDDFDLNELTCGGEFILIWEATSDCQDPVRDTTTVTISPHPLVMNVPKDTLVEACNIKDFYGLVGDWQQNDVVSFSGACNSDLIQVDSMTFKADKDDYLEYFFCGGEYTFTWYATDVCSGEQLVDSSKVILSSPDDPYELNAPEDTVLASCADSSEIVQTLFKTIFDVKLSGGCTDSFPSTFTVAELCEIEILEYDSTPRLDVVVDDLLCGGELTLVYKFPYGCSGDLTDTTKITVLSPAPVVLTAPDNDTIPACTSADAIYNLFEAWLAEVEYTDGCNLQVSYDSTLVAPDTCGGEIEVIWTATSNCEAEVSDTATFIIEEAPAMVLTAPDNDTIPSCASADAIDDLFEAWLDEVTYDGGCDLKVSYDSTLVAPAACGGSVQVIWTANSSCEEPLKDTAYFVVEDTPDLVLTCPGDTTEVACQDESAIAASFASWIAGFGVEGGCNPQVTYYIDTTVVSLDTLVAPDICGGAITISAVASDDCQQGGRCSSTFTINGASPVEVSGPADYQRISCVFPDQDSLDNAFAQWLEGFSVADSGCGVTATDLSQYTAPALCAGDTVEVVFGAADHCSNDTVSAKFIIIPADTADVEGPGDFTAESCDYTSQAEIDADFDLWLDSFNVVSNECQAEPSSLDYNAPTWCEGGSVTVVFGLGNNCTSDTVSATFTINAADSVSLTAPKDTTVSACKNQQELFDLFESWLSRVEYNGGCATDVDHDAHGMDGFMSCGDSIPVIWTAESNCQDPVYDTAYFVIEDAPAVALTAPNNDTIPSCSSQADIDSLFTDWLAEVDYSGGCSLDVSYDTLDVRAPISCGGSVEVIWTANSYCEEPVHDTAYFVVEPAPLLTLTCPADTTEVSCQSENAIATSFASWISSFGVVGGCNTDVTYYVDTTVVSLDTLVAPDICGGAITISAVAIDGCDQRDRCSSTFTINAQDAPTWETVELTLDTTLSCSDTAGLRIAQEMAPVIIDVCGNTLMVEKTPGTFERTDEVCPSAGIIVNTWIATDSCGNQSDEFTQTITIIDTTPPIIICPNDTTVWIDAYVPDAPVQIPLPTVFDDCSEVTYWNDYNFTTDASDTFDIGVTTVTYYAEDDCGNIDSCSFTVTVLCEGQTRIDGTVYREDQQNEPIEGALVILVAQDVINDPDTVALVVTDTSGQYAFVNIKPGDYLVQVIDANLNVAGLYNTNSSLFFTTVVDCEFQTHNFGYEEYNGPVVGDLVWYDKNNNGIQDEWYDSNDDDLVTKNIPDAHGAVPFDEWEWIDLNNNGTYDQPEDEGELNKAGVGNALNPNIIVTGSGGYIDSIIVGFTGYWRDKPAELGTYNIELDFDTNMSDQATIIGASGLVKILPATTKSGILSSAMYATTADFDVTCGVTNENPQSALLSESSPQDLTKDFGVSCTAETIEVYDKTVECDGNGNQAEWNEFYAQFDVSSNPDYKIRISEDETPLCGLTKAIKVTGIITGPFVTDTVSATFTIEDTTPPEIIEPASNPVVECTPEGYEAALQAWLDNHGYAEAVDGCGEVSWENNYEDISFETTCCNSGEVTVTFYAFDECGNFTPTTGTFRVVDEDAPTFTAPEDITIYSDSECNYDVSVEVTGDVTDESDACCTDLNAEYSDIQEQGSCAGEWIITRTWTLVDECGNEAEPQVQIITILDTVAPVISCNDITVQLNENGVASITVDDINGGSTDNCGIDTMYISQEFFYCGGLGENQVTLTAIDECGNVSTCTSTVTVEEGVYECDPELYKANADYLELIYCPGGTVTGDIDLFANDEGFTRENSDFGVLTNLPEGVTITDGTLDYINEDASELIITLTYSVCHNLNTSICDTAEVTIRVLIDTDCDDIPDVNDIDDDDDGILDVDEELYALNQETLDSDGDGIVDRLDIDSDNDGIPDNIEWQQTIAEGAEAERRGGTDNNWDYYPPLGSDSNGDGWDDQYDTENEGVYYEPLDMDQDGTPDYLDIDSDGDGIEDWIEGWDAAPHDTIADTNIGSTDADGDGLFDPYDSYDTSEEWLHGQNAIGSYAPLQDMAADTANNIRDWRDIIDPPVITDPQEAEGCELIIPDGFSPNEDGYNDYFEMRFVCAEGEQTFEELYPEARIEIFNRWGNQVYEQENYGNVTRWGSTDAWWNGTSMHDMQIGNDKLPAATYFYILYFNSGGKEPVTGTIFLNN